MSMTLRRPVRPDEAGPQCPAMGESIDYPAEGLSQGQQQHQQVDDGEKSL